MLDYGNEFFSRVVEDAPDAIYVMDREGRVLHVNRQALELTGYDADHLVGRLFFDLLAPEGRRAVAQGLAQAATQGTFSHLVSDLIRQDRATITLSLSLGPLRLSGEIAGVIGTAQDLAKHVRWTELLSESEERLRLIADNVSDLVTLIDLQGIRQSVSLSHTRILGYEPQELIGKPITSLVHLEDIDKVNAAIARSVQTGEPVRVEFRTRHADGHYIWQEAIGKLLFDERGEPFGAVITSRDITERKRAQEKIERQVQRLDALRSIDFAISSSFDLRVTLNVLLNQVTTQLGVDAADILLFDPHLLTLDFAAGRGWQTRALENTHLRLGEGHAGVVALERRLVHIPDLEDAPTSLTRHLRQAGEHFVSYYAVPLLARGELKGVMEVFYRTRRDPDHEWVDFLETLANQAAIAIDNISLFEALQRSNAELALAYDSTLEGWSRALDMRDKETEGHTQRVTEMTVRVARELGLQDAELVHIRRGALLHDIGKMGIPDRILLKPEGLTQDEWAIMRKHPVYAYELLSPIGFLRPALDIPYCHHEKWDGTGYPRGLKGEQIPLSARIFAVVDVWDGLSSDRPYRPAWPKEKALEHIQAEAGEHFDPRVVATFMTLITGK